MLVILVFQIISVIYFSNVVVACISWNMIRYNVVFSIGKSCEP